MQTYPLKKLIDLARKEFGCEIQYRHHLQKTTLDRLGKRIIHIQPQIGFGTDIELDVETGYVLRISTNQNNHSRLDAPLAMNYLDTLSQFTQNPIALLIPPELTADGTYSFDADTPII